MKTYILLAFVLMVIETESQRPSSEVKYQKACWPIKSKSSGADVISKPGQFINGEKNYSSLIIGGNVGDTVISPVDGVVTTFGYKFSESLDYCIVLNFNKNWVDSTGEVNVKRTFAENIIKKNRKLNREIARYVSLYIGIKTREGDVYYLHGVNYVKYFKSGERIAKGGLIGTVGYAYRAFNMPHIQVSRSIAGKSTDPMAVFGLKTSFQLSVVKAVDVFKDIIPKDSLKKALSIIRVSLEEIHPGLYDYIKPKELDSIFVATEKRLRPMKGREFADLLAPIIRGIADSHTSFDFITPRPLKMVPPVFFVQNGEKAIVVNALPGVGLKKGEVIDEVGGKKISYWLTYFRSTLYGFEGYNKLFIDRYLAEDLSTAIYKRIYPEVKPLLFKTSKGTKVFVSYSPLASYSKLLNRDKDENVPYSFIILQKDVALLSLKTFVLTEVELDSIETIVGGVEKQKIRNLIVDVRDNSGGDVDAGSRILSFLLDTPQKMFAYRMVNKNTPYSTLKYSDNWNSTHAPFSEYKVRDGRIGFYRYTADSNSTELIVPSKRTHFSGQIYVMANEMSISMASDFAGSLLKQPNCTLVGRETGSCYYKMNAERFANIRLPQVGLILRIPMVKVVMHDVPNPRIPYGRGVIPHFNVPISTSEFVDKKDVVLEKVLELIEERENYKVL